MPPSIPTLRIVQMDEGSPTRKPEEIPEEPLVPLPSKLFITQSGQQIISSISSQVCAFTNKGKIATDSDSPMNSFKKSEGWSMEQLQ